jgi:LysR family transcriptional regulator, glycine cleavage system transcriptional activator
MRRLPPFDELVAFEAVARHLSFTRAATELCITQSAVSHRIRRLEAHFGQELVRRLNPGVALTEAGQAMLPELVASLEALSRLGGGEGRRLRVAAGSSLCNWWLAGRLPGFMAAHPGVSVELVPVESRDAIPEVDVRILWVAPGEDKRSDAQAPLFHEQVFPVCSPKLLPRGKPLANARGLAGLPLLHKASHGMGEWTWSLWFERLGVPAEAQGAELSFADMGLVLSAAVKGAGVALSRSLLVADALEQGRLVVPFPGIQPMASTKKHVARWRSAQRDDPQIRAFVDWLVAEAADTLAEVDERLGHNQVPGLKRVA